MKMVVHGFGFSGSGAVLDWLQDCPGVQLAPKIKGFMAPGGIGEIVLCADDPARMQALARARIAVLEKMIRQRPLKYRLPGYSQGRQMLHQVRTLLGIGRRTGVHATNAEVEGAAGWAMDCRYLSEFIERLERKESLDVVAYWRGWLDARLAQECPGVEWVALDKCVPALSGPLSRAWAEVYRPFRLIVAHRDPQDQFIESVRQLGWDKLARRKNYPWGRSSDPGRAFLEKTRAELVELLDYQRHAPEACLAVPFEGLVGSQPEWARRIGAWSGLPEISEGPGSRFDPAVSKQNIGLGEAHPQTRGLLEAHQALLDEIRAMRRQLIALSEAAPTAGK